MNIYDFTVKDTNQKDVSLDKYKKQVLLIVNTAPKCGFAPQYKGLEVLYNKYKDKGFQVLNFPSNQFMNQAPGSDEDIKEACEISFGTTYDIFSKVDVNGKNTIPLFKYLKSNAPKELVADGKEEGFFKSIFFGKKIKWNFTKFLVDRNGNVVKRFSPGFKPELIDEYIKEIL